jgi:hypothetical protein
VSVVGEDRGLVRYEDREVAGVQADREIDQERQNELERNDEHEVPAIVPLEVLDEARELRVVEAMRSVLQHRAIVINDLALPKRELDALEALKAAVEGKDGQLSRFVFASDRKELLEQALAVLQPAIAAQTSLFADMIEDIGELRHDLHEREDAQDELLAPAKGAPVVAHTDTDDDQSLDGPERNLPEPKSTLADGPEVKPEAKKSSLSDGPAVDEPPAKSTLSDGPAAPEPTPPPTTLGDAAEINAKPWWRSKQ